MALTGFRPNLEDQWMPSWTLPVVLLLSIPAGFVFIIAAVLSAALLSSSLGIVIDLDHQDWLRVMTISLPAILFVLAIIAYVRFRRLLLYAIGLLAAADLYLAVTIDELDRIIFLLMLASGAHVCLAILIGIGFEMRNLRDPMRWRRQRLEQGLCPRCVYDIRNLPTPRCPECGATWQPEDTSTSA